MIAEFRGTYRWLSNFHSCPTRLDEPWDYPTVEAAYMSLKSDDLDWKITCRDTLTPKAIRELGQHVALRHNWDAVRIASMDRCLKVKFSQEPLRSMLLATGYDHIQEGNGFGDTFWGVDLETGNGHNHLVRLIMAIRTSLRHAGTDLKQGL